MVTDTTIAKTIAEQLGNGTLFMLGVRGLETIEAGRGLMFAVKGSPNKINRIQIVLAADDTYTMRFCWTRGPKWTVRQEFTGVYAEDLHDFIERETGLRTRMPRVIMGGAR